MGVLFIQMRLAAKTKSIAVQEVTLTKEDKLIKCFISVAFGLRKIIKRYYEVTIQLQLFLAKLFRESNCSKLRFFLNRLFPKF